MRKVTYSMGMSLDGFMTDPEGSLDWGVPSAEVFQYSIDEIQNVGVHLLGRKLYETMRYWETVDPAQLDEAELVWRGLWNPLPKVVFSRTLTEVEGERTRLADGSLAEVIERLRSEDDPSEIAIGGADLAGQAAGAGLIDEYVIRVFPVLLGGGTPLFPHAEQRVDLELVSTRTFDNGVIANRYAVHR